MKRTPQQIRQQRIFDKIGNIYNKDATTEQMYEAWILTPEYKNHIEKCVIEVNKIKTKSK